MADRIYFKPQVRRLMDNILPSNILAQHRNPVLNKLPQFIDFGWNNCTPQSAGMALRNSLADVNPHELLEHAAQAKRWVVETTTIYIDGQLPDMVRPAKFVKDLAEVIQFIAQVVATVNFLITIIEEAVALANNYIDQGERLVQFAKATLSLGELKTQADRELDHILDRALEDLALQRQMNGQSLQCLI